MAGPVLALVVLVVTIVVVSALVVSAASRSFNRAARLEAQTLFTAASRRSSDIVSPDSIRDLPAPVRRWLEQSGAVGRPHITCARLRQRGEMRTKPDGGWMPFEAEQYITVNPPAFLWKARVRAMPLLHLDGKDTYSNGRGHMVIRLLSLVPVGDSRGPELDQGALLRYLAEVSCLPSAALAPYITWEPIDSRSARATMTWGGVSASGVFSFTGDGAFAGFEAQRYGLFDGSYRLETWSVAVTGDRTFDGVRIGNASNATWKLPSGDWTWLRVEITELQVDRPEPF